ncbi:MAG: pitrilysin family protein [Acidobacteriota bacterium]
MRVVLAGLVVLGAVGLIAAQEPDRSRPPALGPAPALNLPDIARATLSNGLPVWLVEQHEVPLVQVNLVVRAGSAADPADQFGIASLTAAMLDEGAGGRSALELADAVEFLGAELGTASTFDFASVRLSTPVARLGDALPLMADVVMRPAFNGDELERLRKERLTSLLQARDNPNAIAGAAFPRLVFGATHRYGTSPLGTAAVLERLGVEQLQRFHARYYRPDNAVLIVVGDVTAASAMPLLERTFGVWKAAGAPPAAPEVPTAAQRTAREVFLLDKPGAAQSQIRIGWVGVARHTPDFAALDLLNTILGGSFTSRLNTNLREKNGYAYGAGSTFDMRAAAGPFFAYAGVQTDKTAEALREFFVELDGIRRPVGEEEFRKARNYIVLGYPSEFETSRDLAQKLEQQFVYNLPDDYYETYTRRIEQVTIADLERAAERYIRPDRFAVVVVGDRSVIEPGIRALNLGPLTVVPLDDVFR